MSVGCHEVLREGVRLVTSYQEVLEEVGLIGDDLAPRVRAPEREHDRLGPQLSRILDAIPRRGGADAGQIAATAGMPLREVLRAMPVLEELGQVDARDDGRYVAARNARSPRQATATDIDSAPPDEVGVAESGEAGVAASDGIAPTTSDEPGLATGRKPGSTVPAGPGVPA
jgi:DNA-binding transcriptional ArsR family regulator